MVLIADGGSTKCDWILMDRDGKQLLKTRTKGLNPAVFEAEMLENRLDENADLEKIKDSVEYVHFYGAGAGTKTPRKVLQEILANHFINAKEVIVEEDLLAAVRAATTEPGIVCILGTGSNSCYYDGESVHMAVASLGYTLMDEASGNYFGKRLIRDYFYKKMPEKLADAFEKRFNLDPDEIKTNLYKRDNPNTYLASFAEFIFTNPINNYFYKLIEEGVLNFLEHRVLCFPEAQKVPIHFIGSIAHFSKEIIQDCMRPYNLHLGNIVRRPIDGLIEYYRKEVIPNLK
ncbi:hypothetical protein GCM10009117_14970 [Gangjinia marincola]|uniref:N-acetylglucosamine kinase n=1 Tax=Gangjinia marincola TaxID=578463 RepID=A0ABN1MGW3_9FLAO